MRLNGSHGSTTTTKGIGFCGLLTIAFIILKLVGIIKWSWVWVLAPLWIPPILVILFIIAWIVMSK